MISRKQTCCSCYGGI